MIHALEKNDGVIKDAINISRENFVKGMQEIRKYMLTSGIQDIAMQEVNNIIKLANTKIADLKINKENLLYFSNLIKKREY